ncbi:MAG: hypothetical protein J1E79_02575 [Rikenella sp.]|nr:hypothetical protein [Rikenella sp.]
MKTYVITLSERFPVNHTRRGEQTDFRRKFMNALHGNFLEQKLHTIRANAPLWAERIKEIKAGSACLSVRQWTGQPYRSRQIELARLTAADGIGGQLLFLDCSCRDFCLVDHKAIRTRLIARNDGLSFEDWKEWFKSYKRPVNLAIIHFTPFRY